MGTPDFGYTALERTRRRRAGWILAAVAITAVLLLVIVLAVVLGRGDDATGALPSPVVPAAPGAPAPAPDAGGWDVAAETELATRAMVQFPDSAAFPHAITSDTAGPPMVLPKPATTAGQLVPTGFPGTPEGAVAQLAALTETGLAGGDPQAYAQAYSSLALPEAPAADRAALYVDLQQFRARAGLPQSGAVPQMTFTYKVTSAQVKGLTDGGRYAVVCVLGELVGGANGQSVSAGGGDCQAMRYVDGQWRISPGAPAARAPLAWPGTAEAVRGGYRAVR